MPPAADSMSFRTNVDSLQLPVAKARTNDGFLGFCSEMGGCPGSIQRFVLAASQQAYERCALC